MSTATVTSKGQVTIPVEVRRALRLEAGSRIEFIEMPNGSYELIPATRSIKELRGVFKRPGRVVTIDEMNDAVLDEAAARDRRTRR